MLGFKRKCKIIARYEPITIPLLKIMCADLGIPNKNSGAKEIPVPTPTEQATMLILPILLRLQSNSIFIP